MQATASTFEIRRAAGRGRLVNDWLDASFSFSFGSYRHPARDRFGALRALNEDVIQPRTGFGMHPHRDLDIFILPLSGLVEHRDSQGRHAFVRPGQVQWMHAGAGIEHSQMNASDTAVDHHLQVWFDADSPGGRPHVEARDFRVFDAPGIWRRIASPAGAEGSFAIRRPAWWSTVLLRSPGDHTRHDPQPGTQAYLHVATGKVSVRVNGTLVTLAAGDALAMTEAAPMVLSAQDSSTLALLFEFAVRP
jgi:redox-sensitive bicupin YhaK (pirin superfamily)